MPRPIQISCLACVILATVGQVARCSDQPNVLVILADDLGFSDLGCYGGEIETPHLDQLANNGLRFTQFYNTARCWPTRGALLTGYYAQQIRRDTLPGLKRGNRPSWAVLLPELLRNGDYRSYHSGKWHVDGMPLENGFDRSYYLKDQGRFFNPQVHYEDDRRLPPVPPESGYYGTTAVVDHAIRCLQDHTVAHAKVPFFQYVAFAAPHFPLHALPEDIAKYAGRHDLGWESIRGRRWQRIQAMGLLAGELSEVERELGPPYHLPESLEMLGSAEVNRPLMWDTLTPQQQAFQATKMSIHAAMIDRMDREIGRLLEQLRKMNAIENTLIFFLSDNGASAEIMVRDDGHDPRAEPGSAPTYLCLGPGWSTTANTPFRRHKTWTHEGGISTPLIAHWPAGIAARGAFCRTPGHVIDLVPTILEACGIASVPAGGDNPPRPGTSLLPALTTGNQPKPRTLWWSHEGNNALRRGDWKIVAAAGDAWELYDLGKDRAEAHNLALAEPARVRELEAEWQRLAEQFRQQASAN